MDDDDLVFGFKEAFDAFPGISDQTGPDASSLEDPCGRRKTVACHAGAVDIQNHSRGAVEGIMIVRIYMPDIRDIRRHGAAVPAISSQQEAALRRLAGGAKQEFLHPCLPV